MIDTNAMAELLKGEYKEAFERIDLYGVMSNSDNNIYEDRMLNLYDIFTEAQNEGKPVEKIVGNDLEEFCKEYFKVDKENRLKSMSKKLYNIMLIIFIYSLLDYFWIAEAKVDFLKAKVDIMPTVIGILVGAILILFCEIVNKKIIFKKEKIKPIFYYVAILVLFIGGIILFSELLEGKKVNLPLLPTLVISGICIIVYQVIRIATKDKNYAQIKKQEKSDKVAQKEVQDDISFKSSVKTTAKVMAQRFTKMQKKYEKKGKGELTQSEFSDIVRKEVANGEKGNKCLIILCAGLVIYASLHEMINNSVMEGLIYMGILSVVEFWIYRWTSKITKESYMSQLFIVDECDKKGINIIEYADQME